MEALVHITGYAGTEVEVRGGGTVSASGWPVRRGSG